MLAVILAGGKGTRLRPFTFSIPKPLLPLGETPVLEIVLKQLHYYGIRNIALMLGHMSHLIEAAIGQGERFGLSIDYYVESTSLGTAGPLKLLKHAPDDFIVMNGDLLTTLDFHDLYSIHSSSGCYATIATMQRTVNIDYGVIISSDDGKLLGYSEKPTIPYVVSMGINVISSKALSLIPSGTRFDMPQLMESIIASGRPVKCLRQECYWQDIGRFEDYQQASNDFLQDPAKFLHQS